MEKTGLGKLFARLNKGQFMRIGLVSIMLIINLASALAYVQSHNFSEIRNIDKNLDMYGKNITNVSRMGIGVLNPTVKLDIDGGNSITAVSGKYNATVFGDLGRSTGIGVYAYGTSRAVEGVHQPSLHLGYIGSSMAGVYGQYDVSNYGYLGLSNIGVQGYSSSGTAIYGSTSTGNAGVFMGKVGIGTQSPSAGLDVSAGPDDDGDGHNLTIKAASFKVESNSTKALVSIGYSPEYDVSINPDSASLIVSGKVGIGTASPAGMLNVFDNSNPTWRGNLTFTGSVLTLQETNPIQGRWPYIEWRNSSNDRGAYLGWGSSNVTPKYVELHLENGNNFSITGGNVGIGTSSPIAGLDINKAGGQLRLSGGAVAGGVWTGSGDDMHMGEWTSAKGIMVNLTTGNVGIGTQQTYGRKLDVQTTSQIALYAKTTDPSYASVYVSHSAGGPALFIDNGDIASHGRLVLETPYDSYVPTYTLESYGTILANVTSGPAGIFLNGNVGIGKTDPHTKLDVAGEISAGYASEAHAVYSTALGYYVNATGQYSIAVGDHVWSKGDHSIAMGEDSNASYRGSVALGVNNLAEAPFSIALGVNNRVSVGAGFDNGMAIGNNCGAHSSSALAMGYHSNATGSKSIAIGEYAQAFSTNSMAMGYFAKTTAARAYSWGGSDSCYMSASYCNNTVAGSYAIYGDLCVGSYNTACVAPVGTGDGLGDAYISGDLKVGGALTKGSGTFLIDHPLHPKEMLLSHSFAESPEMLNIYKGNNRTVNSKATITMPDWFVALNGNNGDDYSFSITPLNGFCGGYYVDNSKIAETGEFTLNTERDCEFSWVVYAVRHDNFALAKPIKVEENKTDAGYRTNCYISPDAFGEEQGGRMDCNAPLV